MHNTGITTHTHDSSLGEEPGKTGIVAIIRGTLSRGNYFSGGGHSSPCIEKVGTCLHLYV